MLMLLQGVTNINCFKILLNIILESYITNRVVSLWNSLPDGVMNSDTINCFKCRLDNFWTNQDVLDNWEADFTGTGNWSFCSLQRFLLNLLKFNGDEDMDIEALPASVNFRCLVLSYIMSTWSLSFIDFV